MVAAAANNTTTTALLTLAQPTACRLAAAIDDAATSSEHLVNLITWTRTAFAEALAFMEKRHAESFEGVLALHRYQTVVEEEVVSRAVGAAAAAETVRQLWVACVERLGSLGAAAWME